MFLALHSWLAFCAAISFFKCTSLRPIQPKGIPVTVSFESNNIEDLKKQITEYAICHLGLKIQEDVKNYLNRDDVKRNKAQGRRFGYRKKAVAESIVPEKSDGAGSNQVGVVEPTPVTVFPDSPKKDECKQMVAAVMGKFQDSLGQKEAFQKAKACLEEFGAVHLDHLNPASYDNFMEHCKKIMGSK
jgi:hypothetical protein